ncbi:putative claudin-24 [Cololabis saira]|uniref:putative claudin-24 n=1 Tax=Cololabis saira TaxID=129043 RepID=UPI002AD26499|nr:putative claudin-24 [Cololabis saira]
MDPSVGGLELPGVLVLVGALVCSLATTLMSSWLTLSSELLPTEIFTVGLWETCVVQELGMQGCRPYDGLLGLPPDIQLARILMCTALVGALLGLVLAIPGLNLVNCHRRPRPEDQSFKRALRAAGALLSLAAGVLVLVPVSYIAHLTVLRFFDETVPEMVPRWEFGDALFCGWTAAVLHLVAGALLLVSCRRLQQNCNPTVQFPLAQGHQGRRTARSRAEYI